MLRDLAAKGKTTYEIAEAIGCTRPAVCGMAFRNGIALLAKSGKFGVSPGSVKRDPRAVLPLEERIGVGNAIAALMKFQCHWPMGSPTNDDFHFCSKPIGHYTSSPYCEEHQHIADGHRP